MPAATAPPSNGPYCPLSAFYADDDAVIALELAGDDLAELLFLRCLAHCSRDMRLDGYISHAKLLAGRIIARPVESLERAADALVDVGLLMVADGGGWLIRSWLKWNRSNDEITGRRGSDAGRKRAERAKPDADPGGVQAESEQIPGGVVTDISDVRADSERTPPPVRAESAHQYIAAAAHSNATHSSGSSNAAVATAEPWPPPPPVDDQDPIADLAGQLAAAGITVAWQLNDAERQTVAAALARHGPAALVEHAKARYRPDQPAFSARAFIAGWSSLPKPKRREKRVAVPCIHGSPDANTCALCRHAERSTE